MPDRRDSEAAPPAAIAGRRVSRKARPRNRRTLDIPAAIRMGLALGLGLQLVVAAFVSPLFDISQIDVRGGRIADPVALSAASGASIAGNIFSTNLVSIRKSLEADPVYSRARVQRLLPNRLRIELEQREVASQVQGAGRILNLDETGFAFEQASGGETGLSLLQVPATRLPVIGERLDEEMHRTMLESFRLAEMGGLRLARVQIDGQGEVWFHVETDPGGIVGPRRLFRVRIGRPTELAKKISDTRQVLLARPDLPQTASYLNVMCAGRPAYTRMARGDGNR